MTTHTHDGPYWQCRQRPVPDCPRCAELAQGAVARAGWSDRQRASYAAWLAALAAHDCRRAGCGPVCTFGDW